MSAIEKLEQRLSAVEAELAAMKAHLRETKEPWWKAWMGAFEDDPLFEKAMNLGKRWRASQRSPVGKSRRKAGNGRT